MGLGPPQSVKVDILAGTSDIPSVSEASHLRSCECGSPFGSLKHLYGFAAFANVSAAVVTRHTCASFPPQGGPGLRQPAEAGPRGEDAAGAGQPVR